MLYSFLFLLCVTLHEFAHLFLLYRSGAKIIRITVFPFGIDIYADTSRISYKKELICTLAGSIANMVFAAIGLIILFTFPSPPTLFFVLCNLFLGFMNLIPLSFFDGGRALRLFLYDTLDIDTAFRAAFFCDLFFSVVSLFVCIYLISFSGFNLSVIMIAVYAFTSIICLNTAKRSRHASAPL